MPIKRKGEAGGGNEAFGGDRGAIDNGEKRRVVR